MNSKRSVAPPLSKLSEFYPSPEWVLIEQVRSRVGPAAADVLRTADAVAVRTWGGGMWCMHGFEFKASRGDWLREIAKPEKSAPIKLYCEAWWLVVPAPRKLVVHSFSELPRGWGLIEVGAGGPVKLIKAAERKTDDPLLSFMLSLLRAASSAAGDDGQEHDGAPRSLINRPHLSREHVGLVCDHVAPRPLAKALPRSVPCVACAEGKPADREVIEAALEDASAEDLARFEDIIRRRTSRGAAA